MEFHDRGLELMFEKVEAGEVDKDAWLDSQGITGNRALRNHFKDHLLNIQYHLSELFPCHSNRPIIHEDGCGCGRCMGCDKKV